MITCEETDYWRAPHARIPVRGHVAVPPGADGKVSAADAAVFLAAAAVTTGTVLIENWPAAGAPEEATVRTLFASMGLYVVASSDGLTVTSRSIGEDLLGVEADLSAAPNFAPLAAAVAVLAESPSILHGITASRAESIAENLGNLGARIHVDGSTVRIYPAPLAGDSWIDGGDPNLAFAGMVVALRVPGLRVGGLRSMGERIPGFESLWIRLLTANEYLLPGSRKLPLDYLLTPGDSLLLMNA